MSNLDAILIPRKTFSLGENLEERPREVSHMPNAINKHSDKIGEEVHVLNNRKANMKRLRYSEELHILHQTHSSPEGFRKSHVAYAIKTCQDDKEQAFRDSSRALRRLRNEYNPRFRRSPQSHAWRMYHHAICLTEMTIDKSTEIKLEHQQNAKEYQAKHWEPKEAQSAWLFMFFELKNQSDSNNACIERLLREVHVHGQHKNLVELLDYPASIADASSKMHSREDQTG